MKNPCRIDARNNHAKNIENDANMEPKWTSKSIPKTWKNYTKNITKNDAKIKRQKAIRPEGPWAGSEGAHGPGVPEEVRSSSGDSRSRFPLASNILQKTNTRQTTKKQPRTSNSHLTRTWRAGRHGADLSIYWAQGPPGIGAQSAPPWRARLSVFMFSVKKSSFRSK